MVGGPPMFRSHAGLGVCCLAATFLAAVMVGCEKKPSAEARPGIVAPPTGDAQAVEARLAKADALDGKADKVVSKCAGCALGMEGKKEFAAMVSGYTLHFCSQACKTEFEKDPQKAVMAMKVPAE